jgi:hypothetical protein
VPSYTAVKAYMKGCLEWKIFMDTI